MRTSGISGSKRLNIDDEVLAFDLGNAVSLRLLKFDREVAENQAKLIAYEVSKIFGDGSDTDGDDLSQSQMYTGSSGFGGVDITQ